MRFPSIPLFLAVIALAGGCAIPERIVPMQSTAADLRSQMGKPTDVRTDRNGDELWEYAGGPAGTQSWRFRVGPDGKVKERTQLITEERFSQITVGKTTKPELRDLLGSPADTLDLRSGEVWEWRMQQGPQLGHYAVRFGPGDVVAERIVVYDASSDSDDRGDGK